MPSSDPARDIISSSKDVFNFGGKKYDIYSIGLLLTCIFLKEYRKNTTPTAVTL